MGESLNEEEDTLIGQSRVCARDMYQVPLTNILENFEQQFDNQVMDFYQTLSNAFKIQLDSKSKVEEELRMQKQANDLDIQNQQRINDESDSFKEEFHLKIQNLKRDVRQKKNDLDSLKEIKQLEL